MTERSETWSPERVARVFRGEDAPPSDAAELEGLMGRVVRVMGSERPTALATEGKRLAWVFGADALFDALPHRSSGWSFLRSIQGMGAERDTKLRGYVEQGYRWLLLVAPTPNAWPADWDGLLAAMGALEPEVASRVAPHVPRFRDGWLRSLFDADALARANAPKHAPQHPDFVSVERFLSGEPTAERAALLLLHVFGVNEDYRGDGRMDGGYRELFTENRRVEELQPRALIDLCVEAR